MRDIAVTHKTCSKCKEYKPAIGFSRSNRYKSGLFSVCKACHTTMARAWNIRNEARHRQLKSESAKRVRRETAPEGSPCVVYSPDGATKWCPHCRTRKLVSEFHASIHPGKVKSWCVVCTSEYQAKKIAKMDVHKKSLMARKNNLAQKKMTIDIFEEKMVSQGGVCAICHNPNIHGRLHVDHDHSCCPGQKTCGGCTRGLLCTTCNISLHAVENTPNWAQLALEYLQKHKRA